MFCVCSELHWTEEGWQGAARCAAQGPLCWGRGWKGEPQGLNKWPQLLLQHGLSGFQGCVSWVPT